MVHSKQVNKSWTHFRDRELEGGIIIKSYIYTFTVPGTVLRDFLVLTPVIVTVSGVGAVIRPIVHVRKDAERLNNLMPMVTSIRSNGARF